ncbi:MAG TPA: chromosome segregation protein SMC [Candidatus Limnocylindria bacterium]|nr:chromosome segregation protein SMC [Candidatus Limnocylindria bacterium]
MYLKNLTMFGFKSFADRTSLNFQPGVAAIVGPNGCGKSNVSDAIRWVLGEQSAKALRGGEMADVIFNGTDSRKPIGMAEVSLTIGGVDEEHLKTAGVELSYNEVTVTRRVFRDGGSEYFINKTPCRLKDIQQFFMGTGMGKTSYSIMAQGNITQILSSKPDDRRLVFEEAAGITKFKSQKKEALRKLEYTDQNLLRIQDLIREVKRQIGSLQRQAGKARRYKQIAEELRHLETQLARHQFDVLQQEISERTTAAETLRSEMEDCSATVLRAEDEILQLRARLSELEEYIAESQQKGMELKGQSDRHESRMHFNEERLRELEQQNARALHDINEAEERVRAAKEELVIVTEKLDAANVALEQHRKTLETKREMLQSVEQDLISKQDAMRKAQSDAFAAAQQLTRVRNEINALDLQKQGNTVRLEKLSVEKIQLEEERSRLEVRLHEFAAHVEIEKVNVQTSRGTVEERQARLRQIQIELNRIGQELDAVVRQQAEKRSRLNVLEQLQESHEGFSAGALAALKQSKSVLGSLADKIRVPDEYIAAIESVLGHNLQLVLTEHPESAQEILSDLSANKKGRASIAALSLQRAAGLQPADPHAGQTGSQNPEPHSVTEFCRLQTGSTLAIDVIEVDDSIRPLVNALLGQCVIVNDLAAATTAWREGESAFDFVTRDGELLNRHGIYTGGYLNGSSNGKAPSSILGRKNQIAELQSQLTALQEQVSEISRGKGALQGEQTALQASLQEAQTELRQQEVAIATHEGEFKALQNSQRVLHQKIDTVVYEVQSLAAQEKEGNEKRAVLATQVSESEVREKAAQDLVTQLGAGLDELRHQRDAANASLTETKVLLATDEQLAASFGKQRGPLEQRIRELTSLAEQRRNEISSCIKRKEQAETENEESRRQMERLQHERDIINAQTAELVGQKSAVDSDVSEREDSLRGERNRLTALQQQRGAIDVELAQKNMGVQNLRERIQQKYQVNIDDIRSECITITYADEGAAKVQTLTPEEMAATGAGTDWNAITEQVSALQQRLDEMGPVNLVAIEEYEETEQRHTFLSTQYDDLVKAKAELAEVINRINTQTKEMFITTFNQIRENFRNMFIEVFGGGKADLILTDENDVLESGIDIVARPPGKQLQSISLLSGGEQTMTAVALLFSIYQVKPSPFCVLDELDAPLDESNINRFIRVLQRFIEHSQFIIITHNKRTIGMADVLYGVTMQEHGVSKIVSVKFHKSNEPVNATTTTTGHERELVPQPPGLLVEQMEDAPHTREETLEVAPK